MHESFQRALNPQSRHVCLGLPLQPLQLGHLWLLHELESPIVRWEPFAFQDLLPAVLICAQGQAEARQDIRRGWWMSVFAAYWGWRLRNRDLAGEPTKFLAYLADERRMPPIQAQPSGHGKAIGTPREWVLYDLLRVDYSLSHDEAMDCTIRRANALWTARNEALGRITLGTASGGVAQIIHDIYRRRREAEAKAK